MSKTNEIKLKKVIKIHFSKREKTTIWSKNYTFGPLVPSFQNYVYMSLCKSLCFRSMYNMCQTYKQSISSHKS